MNALFIFISFFIGFSMGAAGMNAHWRKISESHRLLAEHWRREHEKQKERAELAESRQQ